MGNLKKLITEQVCPYLSNVIENIIEFFVT